jgi:type IV pilus assembly protein PilC
LRLLHEQEANRRFKQVVSQLGTEIENGSSFTEALRMHPKIFDPLFASMVHAGEISGALELTLKRLAEFIEKAEQIKGRVKAALYYPCAVLVVAMAILILMMTFVVPRFRAVFDGLMNGQPLPAFTLFVFKLSEALTSHLALLAGMAAGIGVLMAVAVRMRWGRWLFDSIKLKMPILGRLFQKASISRFARTLGTLVGSGVPILQALTIVKNTAGNIRVASVVGQVHENVKRGDAIAPTLKKSGIFPILISGMVDVGEQTGALPEMLTKIAETCDEEVDNATTALTSLLEPIMIVILAVIVGSIVVAIFLPLIGVSTSLEPTGGPNL